ncbi:permease [Roseomonas nepalensis]|uniref:Permease n=1 Tax=Muricoccus nepalensis TaxID=1854500 RepID=A0A502G3A1_9PROT|nr:LysE family transporter [Roseomonas nepalensis]TPG55706.1 permease [Roseomonas nepalensis]
MSAPMAALLMGASVGLSIAAPIGPAAVLCIERTLAAGINQGLATGLGVATVHLAYGTLAVAGGVGLAQQWLNTPFVPILSGLVLLWFAVRVLRRGMIPAIRSEMPPTLASSYWGAVCFGLLNPTTPILFAAMVPALIGRGTVTLAPLLIAGIFIGSLAWWCALTGSISLMRSRMTARVLGLMNKTAGLALAGLAAAMIARAWSG